MSTATVKHLTQTGFLAGGAGYLTTVPAGHTWQISKMLLAAGAATPAGITVSHVKSGDTIGSVATQLICDAIFTTADFVEFGSGVVLEAGDRLYFNGGDAVSMALNVYGVDITL